MGAPNTTPGSMRVEDDGISSYVLAHRPGNEARLDNVLGGPEITRKANAQQFAASGVLYDALAKATGMLRDYVTSCGSDDPEDFELLAECDAALALARGEKL